ncbi:hypothetical protein PC9H_005957 [Pleurotus ostreatus]|uniref:Amidase domain-containing protein n=1 Tax=Pleurotus ostreatus TaxID=5322 RepID=A0A8H6ZVS7_PLEOS|nr:uncharacterized protein PC9H_005957 [Pleurotus ostreatus]KAF7430255.1 hypothetical protein PC9H_005957 [Pleurotus ostreatus]KAJ8701343.1 hypothetical protein PTI98_000143 [Pleurotus ostreatus]
MFFPFTLSAHQRACAWKQQERLGKIQSLPSAFFQPLSHHEEKIHSLSLSQIVSKCTASTLSPAEVMMAFGKKTLSAQQSTNCLSDVRVLQALLDLKSVAREQTYGLSDSATSVHARPLLGVPISIKDTIDIAGYDSTISCSRNVGRPAAKSSAIVRLLQDAGALIHVKTSVPTCLLSLETESDLFGVTSNPYNPAFTCGASSGGGAALLASGGAKIDIGSDIGGSVRIPAHFCGLWSLKGSAGRLPSTGQASSLPGFEAVQLICAPMATTLEDLTEFWKRTVGMKPWFYDPLCVPLEWRPVDILGQNRKLKWGIVWDDGIIPASPACRRALATAASALKEQGHEVVNFSPPSIIDGLKIANQLVFADGGAQVKSALQPTEFAGPALSSVFTLISLPLFLKKAIAYFLKPFDPIYAGFLEILHPKSIVEERQLVTARDEYRAQWHEQWQLDNLDFVLTPPHALPAFKHRQCEKVTLMSAGITLIFNLLDYSAGVMPVTKVDKLTDSYPIDFFSSQEYRNFNMIARGAHSVYNAEEMHGLPVGIQVVGRRFEEEKVLEGMRVIQHALRSHGARGQHHHHHHHSSS